MAHKFIEYNLHINENGISFSVKVKPNTRLSEANITTLLRQTLAKIEDMD